MFVLPDAFDRWTNSGRWIYEEKLGEGGLATVYKARDAVALADGLCVERRDHGEPGQRGHQDLEVQEHAPGATESE